MQDSGDVAETAVNDNVTTSPDAENDVAAKEIEMLEAPTVEKVAAVAPTRDEMVCKRVRLTGSHRLEKICRPRSEVESTMRDAQQAIRDMERRSQKAGTR